MTCSWRGGLVAGALLLALSGCAGRAAGPGHPAPSAEPPPAAGAQPFFVGHWAASEAACQEAPWRFTGEGLETPGAVVCSFDEVNRVPEGYRIQATCTAEAPPAPSTIRLSPKQAGQVMRVEGAPFRDIDLIACPRAGAGSHAKHLGWATHRGDRS